MNSVGRFFVNGIEIDESALRLEAEKRSALNPESQAVISADTAAAHGAVVRALDAVKSGGIAKLAVSVEGESSVIRLLLLVVFLISGRPVQAMDGGGSANSSINEP